VGHATFNGDEQPHMDPRVALLPIAPGELMFTQKEFGAASANQQALKMVFFRKWVRLKFRAAYKIRQWH
jgi:hypothetical protein